MVLDDICVLIADCPHSTAPDEGCGYPLIRTPNIGKARFLLDGVHRVSKQVYEQRNKRATPQDNDIIFAREAPAGNAAIIKNGDKYCLGQRTVLIRPDPQKVNPDYLVYFLLAPEQQHKLLSTAHGATVSHVNIPDIHNMNVDNLPSIENQKQIANTLIAYDDLIENNQKQIKLLEEAAQRLYKEWFIDLRFPGHESTPIRDGIPEGWERKAFSAVFSYVRGRSYSSKELSDDGLLMANLKNIRAFGGYNHGAEKRYIGEYKESQLLSAGDIIMGVTDMTQERRLVGHVAVVPDVKEPMVFSMDLIKLLPIACPKSYLYSAMQFGGLSNKISPLANGVNVLHLKPEAMMNLKMVIPDEATMLKYDEAFSAYQSRIEILQNQSAAAEEARDRLLPKLMSGEIEV